MIPKPTFLKPTETIKDELFNKPRNAANFGLNSFQKFARSGNLTNSSLGFHGGSNGHCERAFNPNANNGNNIKCNFTGCKFSCPPDVVKFHSDIQHMELRNKYNVDFSLSTPEDISRWRAERKARFPTAESVERKNAQILKSELEEGARQQPTSGNFSRNNARNRQSNWKNTNNHRNKNRKRQQSYTHPQHHNDNFNIKRNRVEEILVNKVTDLDHQPQGSDFPNTTVVLEESTSSPTVATKTPSYNSLNLLSYYESDEDADHTEPLEMQPTEEKTIRAKAEVCNSVESHSNAQVEDEIIRNLMNDTLSKVEKNAPSKRVPPASTSRQQAAKQPKNKVKHPPSGPPLTYSRLSLFQKLMLHDVRKVKPALLQCLHLIVDNNFLQDEPTSRSLTSN